MSVRNKNNVVAQLVCPKERYASERRGCRKETVDMDAMHGGRIGGDFDECQRTTVCFDGINDSERVKEIRKRGILDKTKRHQPRFLYSGIFSEQQ